MVFLFRSGTIQQKLKAIFKATKQHAINLAKFAFIYKSSMLALQTGNGGKKAPLHSFLAGLGGGYYVFGQGENAKSNVSQQIVIYLFARVALALASLAVQPPGENTLVGGAYGPHGGIGLLNLSPKNTELLKQYSWPAFASLSWAGVMWLFETYPETLQPSLRASMVYMYVDLPSRNIAIPGSLRCDRAVLTLFTVTIMLRSGILLETSCGTTSDLTESTIKPVSAAF